MTLARTLCYILYHLVKKLIVYCRFAVAILLGGTCEENNVIQFECSDCLLRSVSVGAV